MKTMTAIFAGLWLVSAAPAFASTWADGSKGDEKQEKRVEREEELYEDATDALDDHEWQRAADKFARVAEMKMAHADAALYWRAYALNKAGARSEALSTLVELQKSYGQSKWSNDAKQLELEIRNNSGQPVPPEKINDEELKLMAINGLMQTDPERAMPILERLLDNPNNSQKVKERALFVLSQADSSKAYEILARIAKGGKPDLQRAAIRYLGINGTERNRQLLTDIYNSATEIDIKKSVLKAYMIAGDRTRVLALAKGESNPELRAEAVTQLGVMGARMELSDLYSSETSVEVRKKIIQAMFIGGAADKLAEIARTEPVLELKLAAIRNLGLLGGSRASTQLQSLYETDARPEVRSAVINALFIQNNGRVLVDLARREKDPELKKRIIERLSLMHSKEATDYLLEYLKE